MQSDYNGQQTTQTIYSERQRRQSDRSRQILSLWQQRLGLSKSSGYASWQKANLGLVLLLKELVSLSGKEKRPVHNTGRLDC